MSVKLRNMLISTVLALAVVAAILKFVASRHGEHDCTSARPCVAPVEALVEREPALPAESGAPVPRPELEAGSRANDSQGSSEALSDAERSILIDGSIDVASLVEFVDDASFDDLVAELRRQGGDMGAARRSQFESLVYAHPSSLDGTVALDVVECGTALCVAELRSADGDVLDGLIRGITESEEFLSRVVAELPGSEIYSAGESRRLVFPHDTGVAEIAMPADEVLDSSR